jgi:hypothetical protein
MSYGIYHPQTIIYHQQMEIDIIQDNGQKYTFRVNIVLS